MADAPKENHWVNGTIVGYSPPDSAHDPYESFHFMHDTAEHATHVK